MAKSLKFHSPILFNDRHYILLQSDTQIKEWVSGSPEYIRDPGGKYHVRAYASTDVVCAYLCSRVHFPRHQSIGNCDQNS